MPESPLLLELVNSVSQRFQAAKTILSFSEYLESIRQNPRWHCRNAAQYVCDAFVYFGSHQIDSPIGKQTRFKLFDRSPSARDTYLVGQEAAQQEIFSILNNFVREGRINRLLLLHGPNGSGKSSIVQSIISALEHYSQTDEGILYRFNWIFPAEKLKRSGIGFGKPSESSESDFESYAHLQGEQIESRLISPLKDHPLLILPHPERRKFFDVLYEQSGLSDDFSLSLYLSEGDLSHHNRMIYNALLAHYNGNYAEVLRHIQVERYYISQRYCTSAVTVEPQMHVDASLRQVTSDRSLSALPKPLTNLNLYEPYGALVDANRGIIEYNDMLKRPLEASKYLLGTCETGRVNVEPIILFLDLVLIGTANEHNLNMFKEISEFISFQSRLELIRIPYILRYSVEKQIYDQLLQQSDLPKPITPHTTELASLWAVLTRIKKPNKSQLPEAVANIAITLSPLEKAKLYDHGAIPRRFNSEEAKCLRQHLETIYNESVNDQLYEGSLGASPREVRTVLLNAAQNPEYPCLSPLALFDELEHLVQELSVYRFLQIDPEDGYHDAVAFIQVVREKHLNIIDQEFHTATGLIEPEQYRQLIKRYIQHVKAYLRKEKVYNPITQASEEPNQAIMKAVEEVLLKKDGDREQFRNNLIAKIAVHSIENPDTEFDVLRLFADYIEQLETDAFKKQYKRLCRIAQHCLAILIDNNIKISAEEYKEAEQTIRVMIDKYGYTKEGVREQLALLWRKRYGNPPISS